MSDARMQKRAMRFLRMLERRDAKLEATGDPETLLMRFEGDRAVRTPRATIDAMLRGGSVGLREGRLRVTDAGRAALTRWSGGSFQAQHGERMGKEASSDGRSIEVTVNLDESPLSSLAHMRRSDGTAWLERRELGAGERLRVDFEQAMLQPRVTALWEGSQVAGNRRKWRNEMMTFPDRVLAARRRVDAAVTAVGPDLGGPLLDICCFLKGLEQVERERGWPRRSAKLMLKTALCALDRHYHPERRERAWTIRHWGSDGYRPSI
ncbi:DUF6456 domain-containing protein [Oricola cellulosilytica]|uniref:DUF6456 domain-containing protein n=1 Tax=Oricola cellulosilytica TaxID=1429082 RepID=A0A4R0PCA8_9HYPH|nr:DUF6456 domain-containing protein [Oricola cellulosilytica]TCD14098.1 hypothetical protein E0D97_08365 [Oricola cellulosilytica]